MGTMRTWRVYHNNCLMGFITAENIYHDGRVHSFIDKDGKIIAQFSYACQISESEKS
jgi:hypothetical protein